MWGIYSISNFFNSFHELKWVAPGLWVVSGSLRQCADYQSVIDQSFPLLDLRLGNCGALKMSAETLVAYTSFNFWFLQFLLKMSFAFVQTVAIRQCHNWWELFVRRTSQDAVRSSFRRNGAVFAYTRPNLIPGLMILYSSQIRKSTCFCGQCQYFELYRKLKHMVSVLKKDYYLSEFTWVFLS